MTTDAYLTLAVIGVVLTLLLSSRLATDVLLMTALASLIILGILTPAEALVGFSNPGVMTIAILYVVAAGLNNTGAVQWLARRLLGQPSTLRLAQLRVMLPASLLSAFMNNTTVVAMLLPAIQAWAQRLQLPTSKLLLPLSYAAILGGTCTLIGTSTNLVIDGLLQTEKQISLSMFELAWLGIPLVLIGGTFMLLAGDRLLPNRKGAAEQIEQIREYSVEVRVDAAGPLPGMSIAEAGLRQLNHGYLVEIERQHRLLTAVPPETLLEAHDRLLFIGAPECARELRLIQGLTAANGDADKLETARHNRCLVEAVIGPGFTGLNQTIRHAKFRSRFQAAIISVSRGGSRLPGKIGNIELQVGDCLLLETGQEFLEQYRFRKDFLLVSALNDSTPPHFEKAPMALAILATMVLVSALGLLSILEAALIAAAAMLTTRCVSPAKARRYIDHTVLVVIAASFSLGVAMTKTGAAAAIALWLIPESSHSPWLALAIIYLLTVLFTESITNSAAAVLMFPIAMAVADQLGVNVMPFAVAIMFAASASFITPLGYQTNLMVMGPGGYRIRDYLRLGIPLSLLVGSTSILLIPLIWSF
ncbi:MAG: di/tricarboxylate transporter [Motiliproteus sp.]|jgi:di/tricarboxylate transporter